MTTILVCTVLAIVALFLAVYAFDARAASRLDALDAAAERAAAERVRLATAEHVRLRVCAPIPRPPAPAFAMLFEDSHGRICPLRLPLGTIPVFRRGEA